MVHFLDCCNILYELYINDSALVGQKLSANICSQGNWEKRMEVQKADFLPVLYTCHFLSPVLMIGVLLYLWA